MANFNHKSTIMVFKFKNKKAVFQDSQKLEKLPGVKIVN